jgi:ubiquinone biosynthesis protein
MTGQLDRKTTDQLINLVSGVVQGDIDRLCRVVIELTAVDPVVTDGRDFRMELRNLAEQFRNTDLQHLNITGLLSDFFGMLQRYRIQCPSDLLLLTKALTTIEGVAAHFDPTFDVLAHVEPQIEEIVQKRHSMQEIRRRLLKTLTNSLELMEKLPGDLQRFLDHARHSRFTLNLELKRIEHLSERIDSSSRIMGIAMIIAALIVGSSILILADRMSEEHGFIGTLGILGLILAGVNTAGFIISYLLPRRHK